MSTPRLRLLMSALLVATALGSVPPRAAAQAEGPPVLSNFQADPSSLPHTGGDVLLSVEAHDDAGGIQSVGYTVYLVTGEWLSGPMTADEVDDAGNGRYVATVSIPRNFNEDQVSHGVEIAATDLDGESVTEPLGYIDVDGAQVFDERPVLSDPSVEPTQLDSSGGPVTIAVTATDDRAVSEVLAVVSPIPTAASTWLP